MAAGSSPSSSTPGGRSWNSEDGSLPVAYAPSAVPNERFHVLPAPLSPGMIGEIVEGYGAAARRMAAAGIDGVEVVASHGYLPAQFLNPRLNLREDGYGGSFDNRLRFLREAVAACRTAVGPERVVGMRISGAELDHDGLTEVEVLEACRALSGDGQLDYYNVIAGSSASIAGAIHIVPPMAIGTAYVAPFAAAVRQVVDKPVFVAGRINQPQIAEQVLASGQADLCGMTRAMICDPDMPAKTAVRPARRHPRLHRLQPGLHRAFPSGLCHLLHPASRDGARARLRHGEARRAPQARAHRRGRPGRHEGRGRSPRPAAMR